MFNKLRMKITLINTAVTFFLFVILIGVATYYLQLDLAHRAEFFAEHFLHKVEDGNITDVNEVDREPPSPPFFPPWGVPLPPPKPPQDLEHEGMPAPPPGGFHFFFVKTTASGDLSFYSANTNAFLTKDSLNVLTQAALAAAPLKGHITVGQATYFYLKAAGDAQEPNIIVFRDLSQEIHLYQRLWTILLLVGAGCTLLAFGTSFFMANRAIQPIRRAWQQQRDFLSDASHELRTPLTILQTNLDIVQLNPESTVASQKKWLDHIQEEQIAMTQLVDSLLFLARADAKQQMLIKNTFDLSKTVQKIGESFQILAQKKGIIFQIENEVELMFYGDQMRVGQALGILLDNAIRHTEAGGEVSVTLARHNASAVITVNDSGEGIEKDDLNKIFDRFYQVDRSRHKGGCGLGLAIAKWISENHDGEILVESQVGVGSRFTLRFPLIN